MYEEDLTLKKPTMVDIIYLYLIFIYDNPTTSTKEKSDHAKSLENLTVQILNFSFSCSINFSILASPNFSLLLVSSDFVPLIPDKSHNSDNQQSLQLAFGISVFKYPCSPLDVSITDERLWKSLFNTLCPLTDSLHGQ